ncbi:MULTISPECIES: AtpZ/AtpI family protein [unclassified Leeuwenhoekiella]|uniref:AtpZ/AtpI family protein n=1 Tax=unclassified Leeuwenhoekiella TaxID=2615029 RepID=UPI000C385028|nr:MULTISPECIES: AtpZ/AtpI family protein [unclassified Leeuwenhoekiella]MAW96030.1 hypothetical protein [Leeuwenhoekiella sp.]MBA80024.1 hypothetical protein [Leeuwenhoekiella sp.]|tara:strand:+ start:26952 stop:27167 length:216 start_codon:yes stop_codon:yes gene_type:complete
MSKKKPENPLKSWVQFSTIALQMGGTIFMGNLLGSWLDEKFETTWLEPAITLAAVFLSMYIVIRAVNQFNK